MRARVLFIKVNGVDSAVTGGSLRQIHRYFKYFSPYPWKIPLLKMIS